MGYSIYRQRNFVPLIMAIGAGFAICYAPPGAALVKAYWVERGQVTWI